MKKITLKQEEILKFISEFINEKGYPPTVREIGKGVNLRSTASVYSQLNNLEKKGYIKKDATTSRAINIINQDNVNAVNIPIVGKVTAGIPIEAVENVTEYFPIPTSLSSGKTDVFGLKVSGDSMKNAGIYDGDTIIVHKTEQAENGDIVVVLTEDNETTVKRFFKEQDYFRLQPENEAYEPIILKEVKIIGKVIGLYRQMS